MPRIQPEAGFDPPAIDANLPGPQQLFERPVPDIGKMAMEPAVKPQPGLFGADLIYACLSHMT
jgi:hypothetical protein